MSSFTPPPHPPRPPRPPQPPGASHKWQTFAALISAGVGALTFAVGFIGLPAAGVTSPAAARETATVTATSTVTVSARPAVRSEEPDGSGGGGDATPPEVQWSGPLLSQQQGFDLDLVPPAVGDDDIDPWGFDGQKATLIYNNYALVPEGEEPDFSECKLLLE